MGTKSESGTAAAMRQAWSISVWQRQWMVSMITMA